MTGSKLMLILFFAAVTHSLAQFPAEVLVPNSKFDELGSKIHASIKPQLDNKLKEFHKTNLLKITGDLKPSYDFSFRGHRRGTVEINGAHVPAVVFRYYIKVRFKVDALGSVFTTKLAAFETEQTVDIAVVPYINDGRFAVDPIMTIVSATAKKERQGKQSQADLLRDSVSSTLRAEFNRGVVNSNPIPAEAEKYNVFRRLLLKSDGLHLIISEPGKVYAELM